MIRSMVAKDNPRRFQIHLSTAVLILLSAGGIFWANQNERYFSDTSGGAWIDGANVVWPFPFLGHERTYSGNGPMASLGRKQLQEKWVEFNSKALIADLGIGLLTIVFIAYIAEIIIRRGEARKS